MNTYFIKSILFCLFFVTFLDIAQGQTMEILGSPKKFKEPIEKSQDVEISTRRRNIDRKKPWIVFSERKDNIACSNPSDCRENGVRLNFKQSYFVKEIENNWLHLVTGIWVKDLKIRNAKRVGWIHRDSMLLWSGALRLDNSQIKRKAFVLNTINEAKEIMSGEKKNLLNIYASPTSREIINTNKLYDFFFVYKVYNAKNDTRLLIGSTSSITTRSSGERILGWVNQKSLTEWNTRLAFEPNFDSLAFWERKDKPSFRLRAGSIEFASNLADYGSSEKNAFWDKDPAIIDTNLLVTSKEYGTRRLPGQVVRFPLLNNPKNANAFKSGLIGQLIIGGMLTDELPIIKIIEKLRNYEKKLNNYKIIFFVEGTEYLSSYKPQLVESIEKIDKFLSSKGIRREIGVSVYRDISEEKEKELEVIPLTSDLKSLKEKIGDIDFYRISAKDNDSYTNLHYGIKKGLKESSLGYDEATNIFIFLGNNADFACDTDRRNACKVDPDCKDNYLIKRDNLADELSKYNPHLLFLQPSVNNELSTLECFQDLTVKYLMEGIADNNYEVLTNLGYYTKEGLPAPEFKQIEENTAIIDGGITSAKFVKNISNNGEIVGHLEDIIGDVYQVTKDFKKIVQSVFDEGEIGGNGPGIGGFSKGIMKEIVAVCIENDLELNEVLRLLVSSKIKLFTEVHIPKTIKGANNDAIKPVAFVSHKDLGDFLQLTSGLGSAIDKSESEKKQIIEKVIEDALKSLTGNEDIDIRKSSLNSLHPIASGLCNELQGLKNNNITGWWNCPIEKFLDANNEKLIYFMDAVMEQDRVLRQIYTKGIDYEYSYKLGSYSEEDIQSNRIRGDLLYYWLPIDLLFKGNVPSDFQCDCK